MPVGTPFHPRTSELCRSMIWRHWSGYLAAGCYGDFVQPEYAAIRNGAALIDVSPLFKYRVAGRDAGVLVDRVVTRDCRRIEPMQAIYTPWCDSAGNVLQEGTVFRLGDDVYQLNAAEPTHPWLALNATGLDVTVDDCSGVVGTLALQGPRSRDVLVAAAGEELAALRFFRLALAEVGDVPVLVSRTGYTGDLGYEVWVDADRALAVWDALVDAGTPLGLQPCGLQAMDVARVEAGFILIDVDYTGAEKARIPSEHFSPYELGLGWAVHLDKEPFVGQEALRRQARDGVGRRLAGVELEWEPLERLYGEAGLMPDLPLVPCREAVPLYRGSRQVGRVTTRVWSTLLKRYVGIALVDAGRAAPGSMVEMEVTVDFRRRRAPARIVDLPHFRPPRLRAGPQS